MEEDKTTRQPEPRYMAGIPISVIQTLTTFQDRTLTIDQQIDFLVFLLHVKHGSRLTVFLENAPL